MKMKELLKEWRTFLKESVTGENELYHATNFPPEYFINGINAKRAMGNGQGYGFFVYRSRDIARNHLSGIQHKEEEYSGEPNNGFIVVIDEPITPENFDIDYEVSGTMMVKYIISQGNKFLGSSGFSQGIKFDLIRVMDDKLRFKASPGQSTNRTLNLDTKLVFMVHAPILQQIIYSKPDSLLDFESFALKEAGALKYNGDKIIIPKRIEDLNGNVLWQRN